MGLIMQLKMFIKPPIPGLEFRIIPGINESNRNFSIIVAIYYFNYGFDNTRYFTGSK